MKLFWSALAALLLLWPSLGQAHHPQISALVVHIQPDKIDTLLDLDAAGLGEALRLDRDGNNVVDQEEFEAGRQEVMAYLDARFSVHGDGQACAPGEVERYLVSGKLDKLRVLRAWTCPGPVARVTLTNEILMERPGGHTHVTQVQLGEQVEAYVLDASQRQITVDARSVTGATGEAAAQDAPAPRERGWWSLFTEFLWQGVLHILIGLDHILFVLVLLVAVRSFKELAGVVTSFTLAHSVTLALGALQIANPEPSLVESVIALSIVYVSVENLSTEEPRARYVVTFFFGLVHGFGFSGVLRDLGLPQEGLVPALLAFNLGVEAGQLAIVAPLFPLVMWARRKNKRWGRRLTVGLSVPVLIIATLWFIERAFDVSLLPEIGG